MGQSLAKIVVHLIFSTKDRLPVLTPAGRGELNAHMVGILRELESPGLLVNSVADHAHILFVLSKNVTLAKAFEEARKGSSKWPRTRGLGFTGFHRQNGYGGFSVSESGQRGRQAVHCGPGGAPSAQDVPGGLAGLPATVRRGVRRTICPGLSEMPVGLSQACSLQPGGARRSQGGALG